MFFRAVLCRGDSIASAQQILPGWTNTDVLGHMQTAIYIIWAWREEYIPFLITRTRELLQTPGMQIVFWIHFFSFLLH